MLDQNKSPESKSTLESKSSSTHIYLYHLLNSEEEYKNVLKKGLYSRAGLGKTIPSFPKSAEKAYDIFFHPLRANETIADLPFFSLDRDRFFVAIAIPIGTKLQVNNRLYSFDVMPLHLVDVDDYLMMQKYSEEGLPEVRININHIPPEYIMIFGQQNNYTVRDNLITLNLAEINYRFNQNLDEKKKRNQNDDISNRPKKRPKLK